MGLSVSIAAVILGATRLLAPEVSHFPGSYFDAKAKSSLQRRAMEKWPGASQLVGRWQAGGLSHRDKMAILLGASASHDPSLLPLYREAVVSANDRIRMAAAYGYRDLLADALPNLANGVDLEAGRQLAREIDAVTETLRERPLVEFWLQGAMMSDGGSMPGWRGVVLQRSRGICFRAVERVLAFDDLSYLTTAYRLAEQQSTRMSLMRLIEAITLQRFFAKPKDPRTGWGASDVNEALESTDVFVDYWLDRRCTTDPSVVLSSSLETLNIRGVDPLAPSSYDFWLGVLKNGPVQWHMMAARQLYDLGGRWSQLSVFQAESKSQIEARDGLVAWYRLLPAHILNRGKAKPTPQP